jgi:hypothetical protein
MNFSSPEKISRNPYKQKGFFEYKCSKTIYAPKPFAPITLTHPSFIPWWQELHDHIINVPVHPLCLALMPDFQPTSEVICSFPF